MKIAKIRKKEEKKKESVTQEYSLRGMIKILAILLIIFGILFFITILLVKPSEDKNNGGNVVVDSSKITISQLLNRNEEEYYVIATKKSLYESSYIDTNYIDMYNNYINKYKQEENSLSFYYIDLDDALNKKYLSDKLNIKNEISEIKLNDEVLFKIKNGKIEKTYVGKDEIIDKLSRL